MASTESPVHDLDEFAAGPAGSAWPALSLWLHRRGAQLREEVRDYPTPIARCDVQLTKLLQHRGGVLAACQLMQSLEDRAAGPFPTREAVDAVLAEGPATDEPAEARLRERLRSSLYSIDALLVQVGSLGGIRTSRTGWLGPHLADNGPIPAPPSATLPSSATDRETTMKAARTDTSPPDFATGPAGPAWSALASWLARRGEELRDEVRDYPTPIARCDVQLTKLLEHRSGVLAASALMKSLESRAQEFPTRDAVAAVMADGPATDEAVEARLRDRLRACLYTVACPD